MTQRPLSLAAYAALVFLPAVCLFAWKPPIAARATFTQPPGPSPHVLPSLAGEWVGSWADTVYSVEGAMTMSITQNGSSMSGTGTINLTLLGLGVMNGTATGTISGDVLSFSFSAASVGDGSGMLNGTSGSGTGTVTAPLSFGGFTFTGTASNVLITGIFDYTSPTGGAGPVALQKTTPVTPSTWGSIKETYR
jgi:hypothetical protein